MDTTGRIIKTGSNTAKSNIAEGRFIGIGSPDDPNAEFASVFKGSSGFEKLPDIEEVEEDNLEQRKRWFYWNLLVTQGKKGNFQGAPSEVVTKVSKALDDEEKLVIDTSARDGFLNKVSKRHAKNKVAKASRKGNR